MMKDGHKDDGRYDDALVDAIEYAIRVEEEMIEEGSDGLDRAQIIELFTSAAEKHGVAYLDMLEKMENDGDWWVYAAVINGEEV